MSEDLEQKYEELKEELYRQGRIVDEIHKIIAGNEMYKTPGMVDDIIELKAWRESEKNFKAKFIGGFIVIQALLIIAWKLVDLYHK